MSRVPYVDLAAQNLELEEELLEAVRAVLSHGQLILGPEVRQLEEELAGFLGVSRVVSVASGTDALTLALELRGVGAGDEVLIPSHSFLATGHAVALVGAKPVFVDVEPDRLLMDPGALAEALSPRTRAVIPVHLGGHPCEMEAIAGFCEEHGLHLVEDCAQAIGTRALGRSVGSWGIGAFSLHPLKTLSALGDAGFLTLKDDGDDDCLRLMRNFGLLDRDHSALVAGHSRLDTVQAAMLLVKLRRLDEYLQARRAHAAAYTEALAGSYRLIDVPEWAEPSHSTFVVRHPERDRILAEMGDRGYDLKIHYPVPIHLQEPYRDRREWELPRTMKAVSEILSLPVTPELSQDDRDGIIRALLELAG